MDSTKLGFFEVEVERESAPIHIRLKLSSKLARELRMALEVYTPSPDHAANPVYKELVRQLLNVC